MNYDVFIVVSASQQSARNPILAHLTYDRSARNVDPT
jgi:hypothetical protein